MQGIFGNVWKHFSFGIQSRGELLSFRDVPKDSTMYRTVLSPQQRLIWPNTLIVPKLWNPGLDNIKNFN